ncbi:MAG: redoxin domain-containing protein [Deltaproteobacteria bacterium]|nr:redoxin domain-containing protein [Deltaproteobacteria bacterium]
MLETELWQPYGPQGLTAYAISSNRLGPDDPITVGEYADELGLTMPVLLDLSVEVYEDYIISDADGFAPYPREYIIAPDGTIAYAAATVDPSAMQAVIEDLLGL